MKLEDLITSDGLLQDEFSLSGEKFHNFRVVGWSGKQHTGKFYIIRCPVCACDPELYQDGYFRSLKSNLVKGQTPCGCQGESASNNLQQGKRPCECSAHRQQECYINLIIFEDNIIALKFGIANNSKRRTRKQNTSSPYDVCQYRVYVFQDVVSCKKAERDCKQELECGILTKEEMPDGYTETTHPDNLNALELIFRRNGGMQAVVDENYERLYRMLEEEE